MKSTMQSLLTVDIEQISVAHRIQLAEDLWDSILAQPERLPTTDAQKQELDSLLERRREAPDESTSWQDVKDRLGDFK